MPTDLLRFDEACRTLGISRPTMYRWIRNPDNGLQHVKIGERASGVVGVQAFITRRVTQSTQGVRQ
jgi:excisionase family DNA binding protein